MTDEALGGTAAPAATNSTVLTDEFTPHTNPIDARLPTAEDKPATKPMSSSDAIKAAQKAIADKETAAEKPVATNEVKVKPKEQQVDPKVAEAQAAKAAQAKANAAPEQNTLGAASEARPKYEPPARFNDQGKSEWAHAPESVQAEVHRTIKNLEDGYTKHKDAAERYETVRQYDEIARRNGLEGIHKSLEKVREMEQAFDRDPIEGFRRVADHFGMNLQAVAAHISGQNPNQQIQQAHGRIRELETQIQQMQMKAQVPSIIDEFAASHERFDELSSVITVLLKTGTAKDLEAAYELASALNPASSAGNGQTTQASPAAETASSATTQATNPAGLKSISGAPASGATSGGKKRIYSTSEALKVAMAQA